MQGSIHSINVSRGGVPKRPIDEADVTSEGITIDWQQDRRYHGGPERALCLYSLEVIETLQREGHPIDVGSVGENITAMGLDWPHVKPGLRFTVGDEVLIEISSYANPCGTIRYAFADERSARIANRQHPGQSRVYARVLRGGRIRKGDAIALAAPGAGVTTPA